MKSSKKKVKKKRNHQRLPKKAKSAFYFSRKGRIIEGEKGKIVKMKNMNAGKRLAGIEESSFFSGGSSGQGGGGEKKA